MAHPVQILYLALLLQRLAVLVVDLLEVPEQAEVLAVVLLMLHLRVELHLLQGKEIMVVLERLPQVLLEAVEVVEEEVEHRQRRKMAEQVEMEVRHQ
jgi:hypothetical protein